MYAQYCTCTLEDVTSLISDIIFLYQLVQARPHNVLHFLVIFCCALNGNYSALSNTVVLFEHPQLLWLCSDKWLPTVLVQHTCSSSQNIGWYKGNRAIGNFSFPESGWHVNILPKRQPFQGCLISNLKGSASLRFVCLWVEWVVTSTSTLPATSMSHTLLFIVLEIPYVLSMGFVMQSNYHECLKWIINAFTMSSEFYYSGTLGQVIKGLLKEI